MRVKDLIKILKTLPKDLPIKHKDNMCLTDIKTVTVRTEHDGLGYSETFAEIE